MLLLNSTREDVSTMICTGTAGPRPIRRLIPVRFPAGIFTVSVCVSVAAPTTRSSICAESAFMRAMLLLMAVISPDEFFSKDTK